MVENRHVQTEARNIASDARSTRGLSDTESEILRDLLKQDEAFGALVTAQWNAVLVDADEHDINDSVEKLARDGAGHLSEAIDDIINTRIEQAKAIDELASEIQEPWGQALALFDAGFETAEGLAGVDQEELYTTDGVTRSVAARITAKPWGQESDR